MVKTYQTTVPRHEYDALAARLAEAVALIDEVDTLAVNNRTGCGTCSTIQNLTTRYLTAVLAREAGVTHSAPAQESERHE